MKLGDTEIIRVKGIEDIHYYVLCNPTERAFCGIKVDEHTLTNEPANCHDCIELVDRAIDQHLAKLGLVELSSS